MRDPATFRFPPELLRVLRTLRDAGHRSWVVGGAVRDLLLGRERGEADFDVATPARPEQVQALFRRVIPTGVEHGTVTVVAGSHAIEVTTFRGEGAYLDGRRPSSVTFHDDVEQDLARRDFTMNAVAFDPLDGELRDPFAGRADLAARVVRAVGDPAARFGEDGLRPLRAVRFAAQLGFTLDPATHAAIGGALQVTARVAAERIHDELAKLLVAPHAERGLALLHETGLLAVALPELGGHPRREHAVEVAARARGLLPRLAGLVHVLAPGAVRDALTRLRFPNDERDDATALVRALGCLADAPRLPPEPGAGARRWAAAVGPRLVPAALELWRADAAAVPGAEEAARVASDRVTAALATRPALVVSDLALDGRGVMDATGSGPGRHVGEALRHLLDLVLEDPARNERPSLEAAVRAWWASKNPGTR